MLHSDDFSSYIQNPVSVPRRRPPVLYSLWKGALAGQFHQNAWIVQNAQTSSQATDRSRIYSTETDRLYFLGSVANALGLFGRTKGFVLAAFPEHLACQGAGKSRRGFLPWRLLP